MVLLPYMGSFFRLRVFWFLLCSGASVFAMFSANTQGSFFRSLLFSGSNVFRNLTGRSAVWFESVSGKFIARKKTQLENEQLKQKIGEYEARMQSISSLEFENAMLRKILEFSLSIDYNLLPTQVIAANGEAGEVQGILIDRGSTSGIRENMAVVGIHNNDIVVVGSISQAALYTAQVIPLTHVNFSVPVQTSQSTQRGILSGHSGQDGLLLFISDVIYDSDSSFVFVGEQVVVNAYSKFLPRGMLIGSVVEISSDIEDRISRSYVKPYLLPANLDYVFVIIPQDKQGENNAVSVESVEKAITSQAKVATP